VLEKLRSFINKNALFTKNDKLLLAFSGGVDSVVLAMLLKEAGYNFDLAHCNFKLRGKESDADEKFCIDLAKKNKLRIHTKQFNTKATVKKTGASVQMAARELRYNWFMELAKKNKYAHILTAHHANDNIETLLINLIRGTGINGLKGIPQKQNLMARPLLFATKESILAFAKKNKLKYRDDSSNDEVKYKRNYLRHEIIPGLKKLNPALESTFENNIRLFKQSAKVVRQFVNEKRKEIVIEENNSLKISLKKLLAEESAELLLFEWLSPKGFNTSRVEQIFENLSTKQPGKLFFSETHKALIDRDHIIVEPVEIKTPEKEFLIRDVKDFKKLPFIISADVSASKKIISGKNIAQIDLEKPVFPLKIRKWKAGDKFMPLGMTGYKKISDFLINQKLNRFEKENIWLLLNKNEVIWVIGQRLDERYKINPRTKKILKLELL
jgi:tRNA(Ile)-lysidine synthase